MAGRPTSDAQFYDVALFTAHHLSRGVFINYYKCPRVSRGCLKNWVKEFKTLTMKPKYITGGHFQKKLSPLF